MTHPDYATDGAGAPHAAPAMPSQPALDYSIRRPGLRPLKFSGTELAMAMSYTPELPYWYEINVYRTNEQRFVLAVRLFYQSEDEQDTAKSWEFDSLPELFAGLERYDAADDIKVPMTTQAPSSVAGMLAMAMELRAQAAAAQANFDGLVGELLDEMDRVAAHNG